MSRFKTVLPLFIGVSVLALIYPVSSSATVHNGTINGDEAQATTCSVGSTTQILGTVSYDDVTGQFSWSYTYGENAPAFDDGELFGAGTATVAHFHGPAAPGITAGVRVASGALSPDSGSTTISAAFGAELLGELWYLNIHSTTCTGGEVRGQVLFPAAPVPSISYPMGGVLILILGGLAYFAVRREASSELA